MAIDRAHIRLVDGTWTFIKAFDGPNGFTRIEDGRRVDVSKAPIGYQVGNDKLVAATSTEADTSTGGETAVDDTGWVVTENSATRTRTTRDKTAQELTDERNAALAELDTARRDLQYATFIHTKEMTSVMYRLAQLITPGLTLQQFATQWEQNKDLITLEQFKTYLRRNQA